MQNFPEVDHDLIQPHILKAIERLKIGDNSLIETMLSTECGFKVILHFAEDELVALNPSWILVSDYPQ